jgi:hypothetical protein
MRLHLLTLGIALLLVTACGSTPAPPAPTIVPLPQPTQPPPAEPTATPVPGVVVVLTATATAKTCDIPVGAAFASLLTEKSPIQRKLGCAVATETGVATVEEYFQRGYTLWRKDLKRIYVLQADGHWQTFADTWSEDQPSNDPTLTPPRGFFQPVRGFGKVWRENPDVKETLGWATTQEAGLMTTIQPFEGGTLMYMGGDLIRVLYTDGTWQEFPVQPPAPQETSPAPVESPAAYPAPPEPAAAPTGYP